MLQTALVMFTSNLTQAVGAVILALVLSAFHRHYQRPFLLTWAWSWWAFCVSLASGSVSLFLVDHMAADSPVRLLASGIFLTSSYWQAAWLVFGTWEMVNERMPARRLQTAVLAGLLLLAIGIVLSSAFLPSHVRFLLRVAIRSVFLAAAFLYASRGVWRSPSDSPGFGRRLSAAAFLLYGLHQVHYLIIIVAQTVQVGSMAYAAYLAPIDFLFQSLIAVGMVIWLLEEERQRMLDVSHRIEHLSHHDTLTDLPNRSLLLEHLQGAIARAETRRERLAVLFLDLDRFKVVNESLGNRNGDELLKALSERLRQNLRGTDLIARVAADEFAILLPGVESEAVVSRVAEKLLAITRLPFSLQGNEISLTASIGISRSPEDGSDAETLLKRAEIAMVRAKETRRDHYQLYCRTMDSHALEHLSLETDLRKALLHDPTELTLFYQPVLDSQQRRVEGVEALLRWRHPARGLMAPAEFLWLAESSGLALELDVWALRTACREAQSWRRDGVTNLQLAVNLSPRSFQQPDLLRTVQEVLRETGFPASLLVLEITETLAMQNAEVTLTVLRGLKELGVRIAIDDFGTGYSSLSYLTTFPIDTLKLDRSFVHGLGRGRGGEEVAAAVIALAVSLEIAVVAEGVEEEDQLRWLHGLGCDRYQGYYFSRPLPAGECRDLLARGDLEARIAGTHQAVLPPRASAAVPS